MTKNAPNALDETLRVLTVAEASSETCSQQGTVFDDLSLIGALLFGEPVAETLIAEVEIERRH